MPSVISSVVIDELIRNGVEWSAYCAGSRNGPLGFELARRARAGEIKLRVRLDQRSSAFVAPRRSRRAVLERLTTGSEQTIA